MLGNLFTQSSFGLDIGGDSFKFIEIVKDRDSFCLGRHGIRAILSNTTDFEKTKIYEQISKTFSLIKKREGMGSASISLPAKEMDSKKDYLSIFNKAGVTVKYFEGEAEAIMRSVIKKGDMGTYMVVNFNKSNTLILIVSEGKVVFSFCSNTSGDMLTNLIKNNLHVNTEDAEKMKQRYGLVRDSKNEKIFITLLNGISLLREEIEKHFLYWHIYKNKENRKNPAIKKIILSGSESALPGLAEYLSVSTKNKVELANVWINVLDPKERIPEISFEQSLGFAAAIGVALKDF